LLGKRSDDILTVSRTLRPIVVVLVLVVVPIHRDEHDDDDEDGDDCFLGGLSFEKACTHLNLSVVRPSIRRARAGEVSRAQHPGRDCRRGARLLRSRRSVVRLRHYLREQQATDLGE
jgi:hypothetical protein